MHGFEITLILVSNWCYNVIVESITTRGGCIPHDEFQDSWGISHDFFPPFFFSLSLSPIFVIKKNWKMFLKNEKITYSNLH